MNELTDLIERATADQPPLSITRESAVAAGRRALRRRRGATAGLGMAAAAVTAAGVMTQLGGTGAPAAGPSPVLDSYQVPQMPVADGVPGAADQPSLVGTDPQLVHFSVPTSAWPLSEVTYLSDPGAGAETIMAGGLTVTVSRSRGPAVGTANADPKVTLYRADGSSAPTGTQTFIPGFSSNTPTTVNGRPATLYTVTYPDGQYPYFGLAWQPVDGLWVGMFTQTRTGEAELWTDVAALRLDRAERVVVPFKLTGLPSSARLLGVQPAIPTDGPYAAASADWSDDHGNTGMVAIGERVRFNQPTTGPTDGSSFGPLETNRTIKGYKVLWTPNQCTATQTACGGVFISDDFAGVPLELDLRGAYDEAAATQILTGLVISNNLKDPSTWYAQPIVH